MTTAPRASVIIPAHNAARRLPATLHSVHAQGIDELEIIVIDDGSSDDTAEVARSVAPRARVYEQTQSGPGETRNRGAELARSDLLMFLDSDDLWPIGAVQHRLAIFDEAPETELLCGRFTFIGDDAEVQQVRPYTDYEPEAWWTFLVGASVITRAAFERVGPFDTTIFPGEDTDWYLRATEIGVPIRRDEYSTLLYRQHPGSGSGSNRAREKAILFGNIRRHRERTAGKQS